MGGVMLVKEEIQQLLHQLRRGNTVSIPFDDSIVIARFARDSSELSLSALIYNGNNYIPPSVRDCLSQKVSFLPPSMQTFFSVEEGSFQVTLHYLEEAEGITQEELQELVEEFGLIAEKWRLYLEDREKSDLVYVHVK